MKRIGRLLMVIIVLTALMSTLAAQSYAAPLPNGTPPTGPFCKMISSTPTTVDFYVQAPLGLLSIDPFRLINATASGYVAGTDFPVGTTSWVKVHARKIDDSSFAGVALQIKDITKEMIYCKYVLP